MVNSVRIHSSFIYGPIYWNGNVDEIYVIGCTKSCQHDSQWHKFHQNHHINVKTMLQIASQWSSKVDIDDSFNSQNTMASILHFQCIFLNEYAWNLIIFSLKFVPISLIDIEPSFIQIMACCHTGNKPLSEPMVAMFTDAYMRHTHLVSMCQLIQAEWRIYASIN